MTLFLLFYSINPKARPKMAGIVNNVYLTSLTVSKEKKNINLPDIV